MGKVSLIIGILGILLSATILFISLRLRPQKRRFLKLMFLFSVLPTLISCSTSKWAGTYVGDAKLAAMSGTSAIATGQASGISLNITESSGQHYLDIGDGGAIKNCRMRVRPQYNPAGGGETEAFTTEFDLAATNLCTLTIQGQTLPMQSYTIAGSEGTRSMDGALDLKVYFYSATPNQTYYSFEFTGNRRGWFF